ncbi:C6 zinc finger domain protein, partial [Penicillium longicatenatum]|uniref:C6 zinc finger domain protein n=1 Tax=Penicillium longicatenatum TaxID=1561947 RepID=UPI00254894AD
NTFLNNVTYLKGHHVFLEEGQRWIESQVGESINFDRLFSLELQWLRPFRSYTEPWRIHTTPPELPSRAKVESLAFPVIIIGAMDIQSYASAAQNFVTPMIEEMTVDGLQSLIMLVQLQYFLRDLRSAAATLSIATRLIYTLGAHTIPINMVSEASLFFYDKSDTRCHLHISLRTGQPHCINDAHCELTLSSGYVRLHDINLQRGLPQIDKHMVPLFPWDLRVSILKSRVHQDLYTAHALQQSVSELSSSIHSLDEALERWRHALPADFRPNLYFSPETPVSAKVNTMEVILRLSYYHCVTAIHEANSRCQILGNDLSGSRLDGVASNISLPITASRSTLLYLQKISPVVRNN